MVNIKSQMDQASKQYGVGGDGNYFKFKEGENRIRILTEGVFMAVHFMGKGQKPHMCIGVENGCPYHGPEDKKPSVKYVCYVYDKMDSKIKMAELPFSIVGRLKDWQEDQDYAFDAFPMPYDIKVKYSPSEASPKDVYKADPAPQRQEVPANVLADLAAKMAVLTPEQAVAKKASTAMDFDGLPVAKPAPKKLVKAVPPVVEYPESDGTESNFGEDALDV